MSIRTLAVIVLCCCFSTGVWAVPAAPIEVELAQPDGTTFWARPRGDEFANWMETSDGHTIVEVAGEWHHAVKDVYSDNSYTNFAVTPANETYVTSNDGIVHLARGINHPDLGNPAGLPPAHKGTG